MLVEDRPGSPESTHASQKDGLLRSVGPTLTKDPFPPHKLLFTHSVNVNIQFGILGPLKKKRYKHGALWSFFSSRTSGS